MKYMCFIITINISIRLSLPFCKTNSLIERQFTVKFNLKHIKSILGAFIVGEKVRWVTTVNWIYGKTVSAKTCKGPVSSFVWGTTNGG